MSIFEKFKRDSDKSPIDPGARAKLFWYLKRKTSYTAWARLSDTFDVFASDYERQVQEEPLSKGPGSMWATDWQLFFPSVLEAQVFFERGLTNLRRGDRTVWSATDRGLLFDATVRAHHWHAELIGGGPRGDHSYEGKYLDTLKRDIDNFFTYSADTGYLQSRMADTPAPEFWGEALQGRLASLPGNPEFKPAPDVTIATVVTGSPVPAYGIYEPDIKNGAMNYLLADTIAPQLWGDDGSASSRSVSWRLIWEDQRYLNGEIPVEEKEYFRFQMERQAAPAVTTDELLSTSTNLICPRDGRWAAMDDLSAVCHLHRGELMPTNGGREVTWIWVGR